MSITISRATIRVCDRLRGSLRPRFAQDVKELANYTLVPGDLYRVLYAPDGRHLVTLNGNGTAYILRFQTADNR